MKWKWRKWKATFETFFEENLSRSYGEKWDKNERENVRVTSPNRHCCTKEYSVRSKGISESYFGTWLSIGFYIAAPSYIVSFCAVGKFGNLRGCSLRGQDLAEFSQWVNATYVQVVICIVWRSVIGNYCDCGNWIRERDYEIFTVLPPGCYIYVFGGCWVFNTVIITLSLLFWDQIIYFWRIK